MKWGKFVETAAIFALQRAVPLGQYIDEVLARAVKSATLTIEPSDEVLQAMIDLNLYLDERIHDQEGKVEAYKAYLFPETKKVEEVDASKQPTRH